ncbi:MAG TPA: HlyD family efflux transporter periplasmic adaptor subunit [Gemmatimonadaceae bacterium]|nr:HlyD family efflux transporter periplasmic adaptor subunit [Gemmatimonadaceae bacterium]
MSKTIGVQRALLAALAVAMAACNGEPEADAYGNLEATEVVVSAQSSGQLLSFTPTEGDQLAAGAVVAQVDTTQLVLELTQIAAQRDAVDARTREVDEQVHVLQVQRDIARRNFDRTRRLRAQQAATAQQMDQAERDYRVLGAQIDAALASRVSIGREGAAGDARVAQIRDRLAKSRVVNPEAGVVLATYANEGEVVQTGQPLYRVARLDTLDLRAYVTGDLLARVRIGQRVRVNVDRGGELSTVWGTVTWVADKAEFTPTPVQTRDERADLVYAIKVRVPNQDGMLKIGMPADVTLQAPEPDA